MKIIVIAGMSAVGKKTLIRKLVAGDPALRERFGVSGSIYAIGHSFSPWSWTGPLWADTTIIQWQVTEHHKIGWLRTCFPEAELKTYWLFREEFAHYKAHRACEHAWQPAGPAELRLTSLLLLYQHFVDYGPIELVMMPEV